MRHQPKPASFSEIGPEDFHASGFPQPLRGDEVHLWYFVDWSDDFRPVAESLALRRLLAAYLDKSPGRIQVERGAHGKPFLPDTSLRFNLSHSGRGVLLALGRRRQLGIDLETLQRTRPVLALARRWFDRRESITLEQLPENRQQLAFLRMWCCKEAVLKGHGRGIGLGLHTVAFDLDPTDRPYRVLENAAGPGPRPWNLVGLRPDDRHVAAVAWRGTPRPVRAFRFQAQ